MGTNPTWQVPVPDPTNDEITSLRDQLVVAKTTIENMRTAELGELAMLKEAYKDKEVELAEMQERETHHNAIIEGWEDLDAIRWKELVEARADADRLAEVLKAIARRVNGNEELRGCEEFYKGYNSANDACRNLANQALASRPEAAKKRAEAVRDAHRMCLEASLGDMDAKLAVSDVETLLREAWGM